jgi:hypothetical protein
MSDEAGSIFGRAPFEAKLMQLDPLLVRLDGSGRRELGLFLEDLVAWNAGARHYAAAATEYIESANFPHAARCILKIGTADPARERAADQLLGAWRAWQERLMSRFESGPELMARFQSAGCDPKLVRVLEESLAALGTKLEKMPISPGDRAQEDVLGAIARLDLSDIRSINDDLGFVDLAREDCETDLASKASRRGQEIASIRQQSVKLLGILLSQPTLDPKRREGALQLVLKITSHLDREEADLAQQALVELAALTDLPLSQTVPIAGSAETRIARRSWEPIFSVGTEMELSQRPAVPSPDEYPEELEDPPGWEWNSANLERAQLLAHALASAKESRHRDRALGPFLAIRAKQRLLDENPYQALVFFREAYTWAVHSPTVLRAPVRWRKDCAWGILLSIILGFRPSDYVGGIDQKQLLAPANLEALFHRDIGALPLAIIEEMQLFSDVAYHLVLMDTQSVEHFIRDHLWEYLLQRPIALQELAEGLTSGLPQQASKVLCALAVLLECSGETRNKQAAADLRRVIERAEGPSIDERELRYLLEEVRQSLAGAAEQSDLAALMIEGIEARLGIPVSPSAPRVTVQTINHQGGISPKRLPLRLSYTTGEDVLRGVQISASLETPQGKAIETAVVRLGHLQAQDVRELGIPFRADAATELPSVAIVRIGRRDANGLLQNIDVNGRRLQLPPIRKSHETGLQQNPYVVGRAIQNAKQIFGRDEEIGDIVRRLIGESQDNVVLVLGERRIGKTTILNGLKTHPQIQQRYLVTYTDMQKAEGQDDTAVFYTSYLIDPIRKCLGQSRVSLEDIPRDVSALSPHRAFENFMMRVDDALKKAGRRLLVILDELEKVFEEIERRSRDNSAGLPEEVVATLRAVILGTSQVSFVLAGITDVVLRHLRTPKARLFNLALEVVLKPLPEQAAAELIGDPVSGAYTVALRAARQIMEQTNRQPYLLQWVCHQLFEYMRDMGEVVATEGDVAEVLQHRVVAHVQAFTWLDETIRRPEDMNLIDALSFVQRRDKVNYVSVADLRTQLLRTGIDTPENGIKARLDELRDQAPSLLARARNNPRRYRISIPLFASYRRLRQLTHHSLVLRVAANR